MRKKNVTNLQKVKIEGKEYTVIDSIQNLRAEDSFIQNKNKLDMYRGNGEARKYVGSYTGDNSTALRDFFEYETWGNRYHRDGVWVKHIIQKNCFFSKANLVKYLEDARLEYQLQEQVYKNDISSFYEERLAKVKKLESEKIRFSIYDVSDSEGSGSRAYIRSDDAIWQLWRELVLPKISYLSILKLQATDITNTEPLYYFRILLDYQFRSIIHPKLSLDIDESIDIEQNESSLIKDAKYREGQSKYRKKVIEYMPQCPFTKVSDERILIASHIKPYQVCINENDLNAAYDYLNGLALTPTYDKLFDRGFITFLDTGELICGTQLSPYTWSKLNINPNARNKMRIYPEERTSYLEYHRLNVFQDNLDDLI